MSEAKQVIVVRKDLGMSSGKIAAQVAHASSWALLSLIKKKFITVDDTGSWAPEFPDEHTDDVISWLNGSCPKIVVYVNSEQELMDLVEQAKTTNVPMSIVKDEGRTEIPKGSITCIAIGPADPEVVNSISGKLPLLR